MATNRRGSVGSRIGIRVRGVTRQPANKLLQADHGEASFGVTGPREAVAGGAASLPGSGLEPQTYVFTTDGF